MHPELININFELGQYMSTTLPYLHGEKIKKICFFSILKLNKKYYFKSPKTLYFYSQASIFYLADQQDKKINRKHGLIFNLNFILKLSVENFLFEQ